jgi:hypothetical protein
MLGAAFLWLDGEGVFEVFHARFQLIQALFLLRNCAKIT